MELQKENKKKFSSLRGHIILFENRKLVKDLSKFELQ